MSDAVKTLRCAIYTRKSTDENLDLEFNSLDAQRESGEAFIASQRHEGWQCVPAHYDDGGFSGGNMERPALMRLFADIEAGKIDSVIVYKVDRLSRSLLDFARIMETLDKHNVSFVSVTQQFNTTTSLGRLTLNILLSFAQFEREIISERTRDKMAATRRKGKWAGGHPILGYDVQSGGGRLLVNEGEAHRVRAIFDLYLERESLLETVKELNGRGWTTKQWVSQSGKQRGGQPFHKNGLYNMLTNVTYLGKARYKKEIHPGEHAAIVDEEVFQRVQRLLGRNGATGGRYVRDKFGALLKDILFCTPCKCGMTHNYSRKHGNKHYRYYVCQNAMTNGWRNCPAPSMPAGEIEKFVVSEIRAIGQDPKLLAAALEQTRCEQSRAIATIQTELRNVQRDLRQLEAERTQLARKDAARCVDLEARLDANEKRETTLREQIISLKQTVVEPGELAKAFAAFDPVWESLNPREQVRLTHLLVQRVEYDGVNGRIAITFHPTGIKALANEPRKSGGKR